MKKILLSTALLTIVAAASAQRAIGSLTVQPKIGINVANLTNTDGESDSRVGLAIGAELEYQVSDIVGISAGAIYSMQGAKASGYIEDVGAVDGTLKLDYINIPILANVYIAKGFAVKAGIQPAFNVTHKVKAETMGISAESTIPGTKSIDFSIPIGLSYEYRNFVLDARYNFGMSEVIKESDSKNTVFQLTLGYKFDI